MGTTHLVRDLAVAVTENAEEKVVLYDPNPSHIWNRLYDALLVREDVTGARYGVDSLDPLYLALQPFVKRLASPSG